MTPTRAAAITSTNLREAETAPLLDVRSLSVHFPFRRGGLLNPQHGFIRAVDGVSFQVAKGETLGIVGESGCGKSTTARAIVKLVQPTCGEIYLDGTRIDQLSDLAMLPHRRKVQMIFQDPFASLNPRMTVGTIISEPMQIFNLHDRASRKLEAMRLMDLVGLNPKFLNRYPHEFSGGQRQRIGIARALAVQPKLIICDEPVSALDVSIQAQVINLLMELQEKLELSYVFIAHDLAVVRHIAHRVGVMYLGRLVETAQKTELYAHPKHPYTQALLSSAPVPDPVAERERQRVELQGEVPSPEKSYPGCSFADRCPIAESACRETQPVLEGDDHQVACFKA
ncbi:MAG: dipeptide ABC transporter ATP-binding protein [Planctomycetaceae bacterium]|nr:dipeptide ABC transporter ATP-binding protein [Planctomycetales bacterium]MCB9926285.1 dipeptide ABC transporter ATP-binding protein [Planctomycetaceae bacterium]